MGIIATEHLTKRYGQRVGIDRVDLRVEQGAIFGFLGPNGAGKTTTIRLLLGFLRPTSGTATVFALDAWRDSARIKRDVGYVSGDLRLYPWMNLKTGLSVAGGIRGLDLTERGAALGERFGLDPNVQARRMSKGMRQKLGLVLAMAHEPRLLILDEPTSGLDPLMQDELAAYLRERAGEGTTVFFSSHTLSEVEQLCQRIAIVRAGAIVADESLDDLRARAHRSVTLEFEGHPPAEAPGFLCIRERRGSAWIADMDGHARPLLEWCATQRVRDLSIGAPDLETVFRSYYEAEG